MLRVVERAIIARPANEVFAAAADPRTQLAWDPETLKRVEPLTSGPLGRGARYRGTFKGLGTVEYEFIEYEPGRRFAHRAHLPMGEMRHIFTFDAVPEGTRLTQEGQVRPNLLGWLLRPIMGRMLRNRFRVIADELSRYLATTSGGVASTSA